MQRIYQKILSTFSLDKIDLDMICDEYSCWLGLLIGSINEQEIFLKNQKASRKVISAVKFIRYKMKFESATMFDIKNSNLNLVEMHTYVNRMKEKHENEKIVSNLQLM